MGLINIDCFVVGSGEESGEGSVLINNEGPDVVGVVDMEMGVCNELGPVAISEVVIVGMACSVNDSVGGGGG